MKKSLMNFFLVVLYAATTSAACAAVSRTIPTKNNNDAHVEEKSNANTSGVANRATASRNVMRKTQNSTNKSQHVVSRSGNNRKNTTGATLSDAVNTVGRSARTEAASINNNPALRRAGIVLRASTAEVGGRATIGNSDVQTGSNIDEQVRGVQSRVSIFGSNKQKNVTAESLLAAKDMMEKTADLNNTCQQQYNECMDQFCAVVDTNQKRCSCSSNLSKYTKAKETVEDANAELNEVAQQIRYVGLSADEVHAIMSETEAELEMNKTKDKTKTRSILDDIADMIKDPTGSTTLYASSTDSLMDLDFDFSSDATDLFNLDFFGTTNDISLKRGTALYNEAKKRCKTVLNRCKDAGGTESQISGNYDLEIAKDCVSYEQGLEKLNQTLKNNVRSANLMLQKARLAVLENKNEYDMRECIGALEKCMLDDMVCGEDYVKCVDPTKKYIDENGDVVLGRNLPAITEMMTEYNNTKITANFIKSSSSDTTCANFDGACIVNYLMTKIGTGQSVKDGGLCRPVLEKCQYYTYETTGKTSVYKPYNDVVVNYIQRAMVNIKAAQTKIISDYASSCMNEVATCYNQQNTQMSAWSSVANVDNIYRVMKGTCYNVALTCGYAVYAYDVEMGHDISDVQNKYYMENNLLVNRGTTDNPDWVLNGSLSTEQKQELEALKKDTLIHGISEMFYQSLFCPNNSSFSSVKKENATTADQDLYINDRCKCNDGYVVSEFSCVCKYLSNGRCVSACPSGQYVAEGECVDTCPLELSYIYEGACVDACPADHEDSNNDNICGA